MLSIFFATLSIVVHLLHSSQSQSHLGSYDSGFVTDPGKLSLHFQVMNNDSFAEIMDSQISSFKFR